MSNNTNFATLAQASVGYADLKDGNVRVTGTSASGNGYFQSTIGVPSGKWYAEMNFITKAFSHPSLGLTGGTQTRRLLSNEGMEPNLIWYAGNTSSKLVELSMDNDVWGTYSENESSVSARSNGDVVMIALDVDNKKLWYGANGTWFNSGDPASNDGNWAQSWTSNPDFIHLSFGGYVNSDQVVNFGQDSTFGGRITAGGNADGNGFGDFKYAPPTGFLALCSANVPTSSDIDPAGDDGADENPTKQFNTVLYTGDNSTSNAITGLGFQPDFVWIKVRNDTNAYSNAMFDTSRGRAKSIFSDNNRVENTSSSTQDLVSFDSDGFTVGTSYNTGSNLSGKNHVAWCWKVNSGVTSSNTDGSITTTVQVNDKAGISIIQYAGSSSSQTLGPVSYTHLRAHET